MFSVFLSFSLSEVITCTHDFDIDKEFRSDEPIPLRVAQETAPSGEATTSSNKGEIRPMRIFFEMSSIDDVKLDDNQQCEKGKLKGKCRESDVLDESKRKVIKETFANVKDFLEKNINATYDPDVDEDSIGNFDYTEGSKKKSVPRKGFDLFITVWARPFGEKSSGLAFASPREYSSFDGRPIQGQITINPSKLPSKAQNFYSGDRQFITTVLHEINHILSFSNNLFQYWRENYPDEADISTGKNNKLYKPIFKYTDTEGKEVSLGDDRGVTNDAELTAKETEIGIVHKYLSTPKLTEFVNTRFGISETHNALGLEIEDGGGGGTRGSHPNERLYFTDLMQGRTYGPAYISPIFYNTLIDSHWYKPDEAVIEKMAYLDKELEADLKFPLGDDNTNDAILYGPPLKTFPKSHICDQSSQTVCFYDYMYAGVCAIKDTDTITDADLKDNNKKAYYNPDALSKLGQDDLLDYVPTILPWLNCRDPGPAGMGKRNYGEKDEEVLYGENYTRTSICAMSTLYKSNLISTFLQPRCFQSECGTDGRVRIIVGNVSKVCDKDGRKLKWKGFSGSVICPPSSIVCANRNKDELVDVLAISALTPDRGPIDGKNLVNIKGAKFEKFTKDNLNITIGEVQCRVLMTTESDILCQMDELTEEQKTSYAQKSFPITATADNKTSRSTFVYTFTNRQYDAGHISAKPAVFLLALSSALAFFFF